MPKVQNPVRELARTNVDDDAGLTLNPLWRDCFLAFMELSHLPPERLLLYAQAAMAAYPRAPKEVDIRYPLTLEAVNRWSAKMYDDEAQDYRAKCAAELDDPDALACCISVSQIEFENHQNVTTLGTLIIGFERRSETLLTHVMRKELSATDVLFFCEKLAQRAISRLGDERFDRAWRHLVLPWASGKFDWSRELFALFETNLPLSQRESGGEAQAFRTRFLADDATLEEETGLLKCCLQGRRFETLFELWSPMYYPMCYSFPTIACEGSAGDNDVHDMLAEAAVRMRSAFRKLVSGVDAETLTPIWEVQSRARRKE